MSMVKQAFIELILLTVASVGVALAANQIRERKSIDLTKDYFDPGSGRAHKSAGDVVPAGKSVEVVKPAAPVTAPTKPAAADAAKAENKKHLEHDFQTITLEEVQKVFDDPQTKQGLNIFVDARDDEHFAEGHIPGAVQCFPYESQRCLKGVMAAAGGAEKVIVYCGGGDCEDSIFMCRELTEAGVPTEAVFLFEGGWKEWSASGMPTEGGK